MNPTDAIKASSKTTNALTANDATWVKFEYFNFPLSEENDFYSDVQLQFEYFKKAYVDFNYMD